MAATMSSKIWTKTKILFHDLDDSSVEVGVVYDAAPLAALEIAYT